MVMGREGSAEAGVMTLLPLDIKIFKI